MPRAARTVFGTLTGDSDDSDRDDAAGHSRELQATAATRTTPMLTAELEVTLISVA